MTIKTGDWVVFGLDIGQIKEIKDNGIAVFSDGTMESSGTIIERCRPLTLKSKAILERFAYYFRQLKKIDGEAGFNYPDICQYFESLALNSIDAEPENAEYYQKAQEFIEKANQCQPVIDGIKLFRRSNNHA